MSEKRSNPVFVMKMVWIVLIFAGLVALVSCVPGDYEEAETAPANLGVIPPAARARADAASAARWQGLGQQHAQLARLALERGAIASAARWEALGIVYENEDAARLARSQTASVGRWQAMGEHYSAAACCPRPDPDTARWIAIGEAYRKLGWSKIELLP